jgi:hypothetical protein
MISFKFNCLYFLSKGYGFIENCLNLYLHQCNNMEFQKSNLTQAHCVRFTSGHAKHLYLSKLIWSG